MDKIEVMNIFGTRPEAIRICSIGTKVKKYPD